MLLRHIWRKQLDLAVSNRSSLLLRNQTMSSEPRVLSTPTAGIIVIGDEILKGQVRDTNSPFITSKLYKMGVRVMQVSVIRDDVDEISNSVRKFSQQYTFVITSGGIGPTHDDVTFEGVAKAFEEPIILHSELVQLYTKFYKSSEENAAVMKLASVPKSAKLNYRWEPVHGKMSGFPDISVRNVHIFPGIPLFLEKSFMMMCEDAFSGFSSKFCHSEVFLNADEVSIACQLSAVVREFPDVKVGSYPQPTKSHNSVKLTIEADQMDLVDKALSRIKELLPNGCIIDSSSTAVGSAFEKLTSLGLQSNMGHVQRALQDISEVFCDSRTGDPAFFIDDGLCGMIVLHLLHATLEQLKMPKGSFPTVLICGENSSTSSLHHLQENAARYSFKVAAGPCDVKSATSYLYCSQPDLKLIIVGMQCDVAQFQKSVDFLFGAKSVTLLAPVSGWQDSQIQNFMESLNS